MQLKKIMFDLKQEDFLLIKRALKYINPYKIKFILAFFCILTGIIFGILQPLVWGRLLTSLFSKNFNEVLFNILKIACIFLIQGVAGFFQTYFLSYLSNHIIFDLKKDMYSKILNLPIKAFDNMSVGDFISRLHGDTNTIAEILSNQLINSAVDLLKVIVIGIAVFNISILLALIVCVCFPFSYILYKKFGIILRNKNKQIVLLNDNYFSNMQQSILGIREIKSLGIQVKKIKEFIEITKKIRDKTINLLTFNSFTQTLSQIINFLSQIAIILIGGYLTINGLLSMEYFIAFSSYSNQFSSSLMNITQINSKIQQILTSFERVFQLLDNLNYDFPLYGRIDIDVKNIKGIISFDKVIFKYNNEIILNEISFKLTPNKKTAIVGNSGSGKTTIFNLLLRFYDPKSGKISIDNINIKDLSEESLRNIITIVRQDVYFFNTSIKENLLLANSVATQSDIEKACKAAYLHDYIINLPQKYDSILEENGHDLSGGQRQRLAIARALLRKSKILLFDEATSALDNESQDYIKQVINQISIDHTVIIIGHRLTSFIDADQIFVLNNGKIVGYGTHDFLMNQNYIYRSMYENEIKLLKNNEERVI